MFCLELSENKVNVYLNFIESHLNMCYESQKELQLQILTLKR